MKPIIEVVVSPTGDISINAIGFKGADCERATKALEEALGTVARQVKKPEYHSRATVGQQQTVGGSQSS
jgi:hypothetical protein